MDDTSASLARRMKEREIIFRVRSYFEKTVEGLKARKIDQRTADGCESSHGRTDTDAEKGNWSGVYTR